MDAPLVMSYINVAIGGAGLTIYGMWAGKWLRRRAWHLFLLNAATASVIAGYTLGYVAILADGTSMHEIQHGISQYLVAFLIGLPTAARIAEYRRDKQREAFAKKFAEELRDVHGGG